MGSETSKDDSKPKPPNPNPKKDDSETPKDDDPPKPPKPLPEKQRFCDGRGMRQKLKALKPRVPVRVVNTFGKDGKRKEGSLGKIIKRLKSGKFKIAWDDDPK